MAAINRKKREAKKREEQAQLERIGENQYYGMGSLHDHGPTGPIGTVIALGVIGGHGYYIYRTKKGGASGEQPSNLQRNDPLKTNKFEMDQIYPVL